MAGYEPLKITGMTTGLVQERENFLLPNGAYPILQNAYVWREKIIRKSGFQLLGRLQRSVSGALGSTDGSGNLSVNLKTLFTLESSAQITPGKVVVTVGGVTYTDDGTGQLVRNPDPLTGNGFVNYRTTALSIVGAPISTAATIVFTYYPCLPVMGIRIQEQQNSTFDQTVVFDTTYAYIYDTTIPGYKEFIPGTTWNAGGSDFTSIDFFWSTNYWVSGTANSPFGTDNKKLFWVTNNSGHAGVLADPPRITDGTTWEDFFPSTWSQIDATEFLTNWLCNLPYRGRMVVFNTWEGPDAANSLNHSNRIRWSTIGNPFIAYANAVVGPPYVAAKGSWRDDIRGQGGFLDIPTSEDIVSIGFVRDNLVIYCERSTWQLRYTGQSIAPFAIERVNSELGTESTFSAVQFDTSLVGIGDKGIVECDSYKSNRIDIKIPNFVYQFNNYNNGPSRVQGIRNFPSRLAYWTVPLAGFYDASFTPTTQWVFPNTRLVYNYENDSWALFTDSLTALGSYQEQSSITWINTFEPWVNCNFSWISQPIEDPQILGGNQQGFVEILDNVTTNDVSLYISNIVGNTTTATVITSPNHNMLTGFVIGISGIPALPGGYSSLNGGIFGIEVLSNDTFSLHLYNPLDDSFSIDQLDATGIYAGGGLINIRENFIIRSKKFNFLDEGMNIQMGYLDLLMEGTQDGAISLNMYLDYDDNNPSNKFPNNVINNVTAPGSPDTFFNSIIPTSQASTSNIGGSKFWQRAYCATRASFLTLEYTLSNAQMVGVEQTQGVIIDAQILWIRKAGRISQP